MAVNLVAGNRSYQVDQSLDWAVKVKFAGMIRLTPIPVHVMVHSCSRSDWDAIVPLFLATDPTCLTGVAGPQSPPSYDVMNASPIGCIWLLPLKIHLDTVVAVPC